MFCNNCGAKNVDGAKFCNSCGVAMPSVADSAPAKMEPADRVTNDVQQQRFEKKDESHSNSGEQPQVTSFKEYCLLPENAKVCKSIKATAIVLYVCYGLSIVITAGLGSALHKYDQYADVSSLGFAILLMFVGLGCTIAAHVKKNWIPAAVAMGGQILSVVIGSSMSGRFSVGIFDVLIIFGALGLFGSLKKLNDDYKKIAK
ncbi:MAG: zinc ribbon domain-containing protein [Lachnospiraceae bacterium]|nr:zinc ribbon domain-containing protein [Lachnospiraceae bacterium]